MRHNSIGVGEKQEGMVICLLQTLGCRGVGECMSESGCWIENGGNNSN